jgi:hypothetical protein
MAEAGQPSKSAQISLDGNAVVKHLAKAGLDPRKLDLTGILGADAKGKPGLDIAELESNLHSAQTSAAKRWHVGVVVSRD